MANAIRDENRVTSLMGVSNANGTTLLPVYVDPISHSMFYTASSGTMPAQTSAPRDNNRVTALMGISELDGTTPVVIGIDSATNALFLELP